MMCNTERLHLTHYISTTSMWAVKLNLQHSYRSTFYDTLVNWVSLT